MQSAIVPFLRCPVCHSSFRLEAVSIWDSIVNSGTLVCRTCTGRYPIFHGRPILLTSDSVSSWTAPIDEIFGHRRLQMSPSPLSIDRLARMGDKSAIERASKILPLRMRGSTPIHNEEDILRTLKSIENQAKYRMWGNWLYSKGREKKFLKSLNDPGDAVSIFVETVLSEQPRSILDIASGSGSGITSIVNAADDIEYVFALDRDLRCLWSIQRKFMYLGKSCHCDAIGGDVRRLPFMNDSIAVVTSVMGLQEIYSISMMMREAARVLNPGGCYTLLYNEKPFMYDLMSVKSYNRFAKAVDMFSGHRDLMKLAEECGLQVEHTNVICSDGVNYRLSVLRKPK